MTDFNDALLDIIVRQRAEMAEHRRNEGTPLFGLRAQPDILQELELQLWRPTAVEGADPGEVGATLPLKTVLVLRRAVDEIKSLRSELALKQGYKASYETTLAVTNSLREEIAGLRAGVPLEREAPADVRVNDLNEGWKTFYDEEKRRFSETANGLKAELAEVRQALGMLTTLAPNMEIDVDDPMGMAQQIIDVCRADHTGYIAASTALSSALADIDRLRSNQRASGNQIEEIQNRLTTLLEEVFRDAPKGIGE